MIEWLDSYSIGNQIIDNQHKELFKRLNGLMDACNKGKGKEEVVNTLKYLSEYVVHHFAEEENLMKRFNYPFYQDHKDIHEEFIKNVKELQSGIENNGVSVVTVISVLNNVTKWLSSHIGNTDSRLGSFLKSKGIS